ncbi:pseudouridine synthase [Skermanella stibiiresistens SB22]|uniref:Pseudouridine synthase n=1 Tax=Skermanella stibiiresistens SB22 TaxID=1385369 RepID=W9GW35_9PROT|nr:pseudouridine synthase [Skermanella stibiiresistens]EWY36866.1 pseudouridine synthase [Skermanella stibiiresistens SB22]
MTDSVTDPSPEEASGGPERIAKRLARAGLCSRRDAERWIADGRVIVNGAVLTTPAVVVGPRDTIVVDGKPLPSLEPTRLWRYHKPEGLVTSARDEKGRQTVFDVLPADLPRVISVGRLDLTTEGLLLLTNDGELARFLELPTTGWARKYRVRVNGFVNPDRLMGLARGVAIDGIQYGPIEAVLDRQQGANAWLTVTLREGKNREVRNVMESMALTVNRLIRVAYGPFQLGKLERGEVEEVPKRVLRDQVSKFFLDRGDEPAKPNTGTAKAKPQPKPHGKPFAKPAGKPGARGEGERRSPTGEPPKGRHETRRR